MDTPLNKARGYELWSWGHWVDGVEHWSEFFNIWQGVEYESLEEGVFIYTYPE